MIRWLTERRRKRLLEIPFPDAWHTVIEENVHAYRYLDADEQHRLRDLTQIFIGEKHWEGCGGLVLTDEMRVTIAATACLLILGRDHDLMKDVESILVYPTTMLLPAPARSFFDPSNRVVDPERPVLGVAHARRDPVVLAWDSVLAGAADASDGDNVVLHEMAHKVDFLDGVADGTPPLETTADRREWARVWSAAFLAHRSGAQHVLREYAQTNEAEFFAVATEMFFEQSKLLRRELPEIYRLLARFYQLDLADREPA